MRKAPKSDQVKEVSYYHTRIKDWPEGERPREKLMKRGADALSDAELLAILIGSGTDKATAVDVAKELLIKNKSLRGLASKSLTELRSVDGIGPARAVTIVAALELGRRLQSGADEKAPVIRSPQDVAALYIPKLRDLKKEVFYVLLLNSANKVIGEEEVSVGTLNASLTHPREIFRRAIVEGAASIILIHNHPSGNKTPSGEDIKITRQIVEAGRLVEIPVHDHVIVAGNAYTSFAEENLL